MTQSLQVVSGYWPAPGVDSPGRGVTGKNVRRTCRRFRFLVLRRPGRLRG